MEVTTAERLRERRPGQASCTPRTSRSRSRRPSSGSATTRRSSPCEGDDARRSPGTSSRDQVAPDRRRARQARRRQGRHGRADAQQPPRVHPDRPGGGLARRACRSRSTRPPRPSRSHTSSPTPAPRSRSSRRAFLDVFNKAREELPDDRDADRDRRRGRRSHARRARGRSTPTSTSRRRSQRVEPDDLLTLIYTSGTTGPPKGVQLTHRNLMSLVAAVDGIIDFPERGGKVISWLPAAHIAERGAHYYLPVILGATVYDLPRPAQDRRLPPARCGRPGSSPCRGSGRS